MNKHDQEKPKVGLVPTELILEVAKVMTYGAKKYSPNNWREGCDWSRFYSAAQRHLLAWNNGETLDPETGLNHLAHAAASIGFLLAFTESSSGNDDRHTEFNVVLPGIPMASWQDKEV